MDKIGAIQELKKIDDIKFRDKTYGWKLFSMKILLKNGREYLCKLNEDFFMQSFLNNYILRPSCYKCVFKNNYNVSDLSLGDFWGIRYFDTKIDDDKGVSLIVINSNKGDTILAEVLNSKHKCKKIKYEDVVPFNTALVKSVEKPNKRQQFFESIIKNSLENTVSTYVAKVGKKKKNAITDLFIYKSFRRLLFRLGLRKKYSQIHIPQLIPFQNCYIESLHQDNIVLDFDLKKSCCGCSTCSNICPQACITMGRDEEGFIYPSIDYDKCVHCGLCMKVCPIVKQQKKLVSDILPQENKRKAFAVKSENTEERLKSSSGGVFSLLARKIIENSGIVFGAAFDKNFVVRHTWIDSVDTLDKLRGSKYVQSEIGNSYKEAKKFLNDGREALFIGTACQIAGLKSYLGKDYPKLITVDVICHGVPSPMVFEKYLCEIVDKYS